MYPICRQAGEKTLYITDFLLNDRIPTELDEVLIILTIISVSQTICIFITIYSFYNFPIKYVSYQ